MKTLTLCLTAAFLAAAPVVRAEESAKASPAPAPSAKAEGGDKPAGDPAADALKKRFAEVRKQVSEDPAIKAALDAARTASVEANGKLHAKMLEIDPSLAPLVEREKARAAGRAEGGGGRREPRQGADNPPAATPPSH